MVPRLDQQEPGRKRSPAEEAASLKGTLVGVLSIASVIAATWLSVFFLFLSRK